MYIVKMVYPPPSPTPASMSKFPSGGKTYGKKKVFFVFLRCFTIWGDLGDLWGPKWSLPIPASMSKSPSRGKDMENNALLMIV